MNAPYKYDIVGSFLRDKEIKQAREDFSLGKINQSQLEEIENKSIENLVNEEKAVGLKAVTDGEFRRAFWHLDFLWDLKGVEKVAVEHFSIAFKGHQPKSQTLEIVDKIDFPEDHPFLKHFKFMQRVSGETEVKQCIPSPSMLHLICCIREENYQPIERYQDNDVLLKDIALAYQKAYKARGIDVDDLAKKYVDMINLALEAKPDDMVITMHICRGNFRSTWFTSGGYEPVAKTLFGNCHVDGFFLEYDSERAGGFEPLRYIQNQKVVLGLVTSKDAKLENKDEIIKRIHEAEKYVPLNQLALSPQCGFASTEEGNLLTKEEQWNKVKLVKEIAEEVWQ